MLGYTINQIEIVIQLDYASSKYFLIGVYKSYFPAPTIFPAFLP
jgi:hypothetical protein